MNGFQRFLIRFVTTLFPCKFYGKENIPEGGAVVVCNHFSVIDPIFMSRINTKEQMAFLAKKEIFKHKLIGKIFKSFGAIPIDREKPELKSLLAAVTVLKNDKKLLIFPEGTRNKSGSKKLMPIKGGSVVLAAKGKYPIVPIMLDRKARLFRKTKIIIGEPFELTDFYGKKFTDDDIVQMDNIVTAKMTEQQEKLTQLIENNKKKKKNDNSKGQA